MDWPQSPDLIPTDNLQDVLEMVIDSGHTLQSIKYLCENVMQHNLNYSFDIAEADYNNATADVCCNKS